MMLRVALLSLAVAVPVSGQTVLSPLSEDQISQAIERGRVGALPSAKTAGPPKGDFTVSIETPVARIASAAANAFRQYRPFDVGAVTKELRAPVYRVLIERSPRAGVIEHVVLQPAGLIGMNGVVQPVRESSANADFDRLPAGGEFDVIIVTRAGEQRYRVSQQNREVLEGQWSPTPSDGRATAQVSVILKPEPVNEVKAQYTGEAVRARIQGSVVIECTVQPTGACTDIQVIQSLDKTFGLDAEAVKAAEKWRFKPGTKDGVPVPMLTTIELSFILR